MPLRHGHINESVWHVEISFNWNLTFSGQSFYIPMPGNETVRSFVVLFATSRTMVFTKLDHCSKYRNTYTVRTSKPSIGLSGKSGLSSEMEFMKNQTSGFDSDVENMVLDLPDA